VGQLFGKNSSCCCTNNGDGCCTGRCCPFISEELPGTCTGGPNDNPLPTSLTVDLSATFQHPPTGVPPASGFTAPANSNCYDFSFQIHLTSCLSNAIRMYTGTGTNSCVWCGVTYTVKVHAELTCFGLLTLKDAQPIGDCGINYESDGYQITFDRLSCDPILMSGDMPRCLPCAWQCNLGLWEPFPGVWVPVIAIHSPFCLSATVYESP